jgi:2-polyprenyl-3-methyl-5-hydroxy-6-metoxy-1,4-benzoquinol methylase
MEARLFQEGTIPEYTTIEWYSGRVNAPHLEEPGQRERILETARVINTLCPTSVVDLGAGDGGLLSQLSLPVSHKWGYDLQQTNVDVALNKRNVVVNLFDVVSNTEDVLWASLVVCTEMLEHLIDPHRFLSRVYNLQGAGEYIVASSPWNETDEDHYEFHTWAWDDIGYCDMFKSIGYEVVEQLRVQGAQIMVAVK